MNSDVKDKISRANLRPTQPAKEVEDELRRLFGWQNRYQPARLAIGRSLAQGAADPIPEGTQYSTGITGQTLLGDKDIDVWLAAVILDGDLGVDAASDHVRTAIEAHWHRGAGLLKADLEEANGDAASFVRRLAALLPDHSGTGRSSEETPDSQPTEVVVKIGSISQNMETGEDLSVSIAEKSTSPHLALMGKTRRGKTYTAVQMADSIVEQSQAPLLFIDPKKEYVDEDRLSDEWPGKAANPELVRVGENPIPLDFLPPSGSGTQAIGASAIRLSESIANCCRGAGEVQKRNLRQAIEQATRQPDGRSLKHVRDGYEQQLQQDNKPQDSVLSQLDALTNTLDTFEPTHPPEEFFNRSWYLTLDSLPGEELQRMVMLLLADSMREHFLSAENTSTNDGHRKVRSVVVIDEARRILKQKKLESLSRLVREGASKGVVMMLLSQDPSDFDGQDDDFTTQLGTVVAFGCNQTNRGLRALSGAFGRKLQPQDFSDDRLKRGVAFCKLPDRKPEQVRVWQPTSVE